MITKRHSYSPGRPAAWLGLVGGLFLIACLGATAAGLLWAPTASASSPAPRVEAGWEAVKPIAIKALSKHLSKREVRRLLRKRFVRRALVAALRGFDGDADLVSVRKRGRTLEITMVDRRRRRVCVDLGATPETGDQPQCKDEIEVLDRRIVTLQRQLWKPPTRPKRAPTPVPPGQVAPERPRSIMFGGYARKLAKERLGMAGISQEVVTLVGGYWGFRDGVKGHSGWHDPFETKFRMGDKLPPVKLLNQPKPKPVGSIEGNAMENLRYIYDVARMRPAWPVPDPFGLYARGTHQRKKGPTAVAAPNAACLKSFADTHSPKLPPTLACFAGALRFRNLGKDDAYQVARFVSQFVALPFLKDVMRQRVAAKSYESVSTYLWAHTWMQWARKHRGRVAHALAKLTSDERMQLRWRLSKWWFSKKYNAFESTVADIYEHHFSALYPNARDRHGWPRRAGFKDDYLWALNWLAKSERSPSGSGLARSRLGQRGKAIIAALVIDGSHRNRFPKTTAVLGSEAQRTP